MSFEVKVDFSSAMKMLDGLNDDIRRAQDKATREVARKTIVPAVKQALSFTGGKAPLGQLGTRTGRTRSKVRARFWKGQDGLLNGAVKVMGDRAYIARFNEKGTKSHGRHGGPLPARLMFETVGRAIRGQVEGALVDALERNLQAKLGL